MHDHWTEDEVMALKGVDSLDGAADIAISILARMRAEGKPIVQICGPMSTGGMGSLEKNMARFQKAIDRGTKEGLTVFNQIPFQEAIIQVTSYTEESTEYDMDILEVFYRKVFECGHIDKALFLPDWESSVGARWERELVGKLGIAIEEYPAEWL